MELTGENVTSVIKDCLFTNEEISGRTNEDIIASGEAITVEGLLANLGFHKERLEKRREDIKSMLSQLPEKFRVSVGGGWSFLAACDNKDGIQWTDYHRDMDALFCLGMAIGAVKCLLPREMWGQLPGGMPYYSVDI